MTNPMFKSREKSDKAKRNCRESKLPTEGCAKGTICPYKVILKRIYSLAVK